MNRRDFLNSIGIGVACLALRIKPDAAATLPKSRILGLRMVSGDFGTHFYQYKRTVFYTYPNNTAPLTGLLSLIKKEPNENSHKR